MDFMEYNKATRDLQKQAATYVNTSSHDLWSMDTLALGIEQGHRDSWSVAIKTPATHAHSVIHLTVDDTLKLIEELQRIIPLCNQASTIQAEFNNNESNETSE